MASALKLCLWWLYSFLVIHYSISKDQHSDSFTEELFIKPLSSGHVYNYFLFTTRWNIHRAKQTFQHFRLFPLSLGEIVSQQRVQELHLSLTQGRWQHLKWGYPFQEAPPGAHLWAWFAPDTLSVSSAWKNLTNALSGQLCASLNFVDDTVTVSPKRSFQPQGWVRSANSSLLRYAALPRESVCTENLTPWKKLLPCSSKAGLATLLHALQLFTANYMSLALDLKTVCQDEDCVHATLELQMSVSLVFDTVAAQNGYQTWSLSKLFGAGIKTSCPLSSMSTIYVDISNNGSVGTYRLSPEPTQLVVSGEGAHQRSLAIYDLKHHVAQGRLNLAAQYEKPHIFWLIPEPPLHITRYIQGYGLERGGIVNRIQNNHPTKAVRAVLLDIIPWFLRVYLHTLKISSGPRQLKAEHVSYQPGCDRERPHHLELTLILPPAAETIVAYEFERAFLKWTEYPPDANHGFYVGAAVLSALLDEPVANYSGDISLCPSLRHCITGTASAFDAKDGPGKQFVRIYTETLLVSLPTPDFSMPYNVICLACTVVALAFGPIHNIATNALTIVEAKKGSGGLLRHLATKAKGLFRKSSSESSGGGDSSDQDKKNK
ncbi:phosphatidylinositol glycan anchor biosynthesis class T isoform X1 [Dermacentor variabilis]|uniref:phosphatidylinositol glycan anchor biosynthesis class T isoform X1 n=1 Tax=Dermacentor variabilis TaxID=34621 RepID=UPI003F5BF241